MPSKDPFGGDDGSDDSFPGSSESEEPTGGVEGAEGGPSLTPPPTDTLSADRPAAGPSTGWLIVGFGLTIAVMAAALPADRRKRDQRSS
jgi:hypothetical protein